jgi:hypothetical protein
MKLLRAATVSVRDPMVTARRYTEWLNYRIVEEGVIARDLAISWDAPAAAGAGFVTVAPASGAQVFIRFVANEFVPGYRPLRTYGWAALEICVKDVVRVNERLLDSPFEIIGPPREIAGLPAIYPMQVKGPDDEIIYLTEVRADLPAYDLPRAASMIDSLFIMVLACSDLSSAMRWFEQHARLTPGREMAIVYTMLAKAFGLPPGDLHHIATFTHQRDVFLELDQYPAAATPRPKLPGHLPPGIAMVTVLHPQFSELGPWISPPATRNGPVYGGGAAATLCATDGTLLEIVELR